MFQISITGLYSRKAFERLGFDINAEYEYNDYQDEETGEKVFESIKVPHRCVTLMTKRLNIDEPKNKM